VAIGWSKAAVAAPLLPAVLLEPAATRAMRPSWQHRRTNPGHGHAAL
jgi:hypothetical protein